MELEFNHNMQLKQLEAKTKTETQILAENRKDDRTKLQASQQSEMIEQRNNKLPAKNFETKDDAQLGRYNV